jgi:hypothetical protein
VATAPTPSPVVPVAAATATPTGRFAAAAPFFVTAPPRHDTGGTQPVALSERKLLSAGDRAGLLPFGHRTTDDAAPLTPGLTAIATAAAAPAATTVVESSTGGRTTVHRTARAHAPDGGGTPSRPAPHRPPGTPGNAGAGGVASAAGGAASGVWCAILLGGFLLFAQHLRRHGVRLVIPAPRGVEFLLHRPG